MSKSNVSARAIPAQDQQNVHWNRLLLRAALSLVASGGFLWLLSQRLAHIDLGSLIAGFETVGWMSWGAALGLTSLSFAAVGHYDVVMQRHFSSPVPEAAARRAGICAIAVSQTLGLGLITGAILRWRMLPGQSLWACTRLTAAVALSFLIGWAFVTAATLSLLPEAPYRTPALVALGMLCGFAVLCLAPPRRLSALPNGFTLGRLMLLTAVDTFAAAAALWVLCPQGMEISFLAMLPAFLLAFGAGLISGAPGGVGPFEIALLMLLPEQPEPALLTAVLAWRACYYALPAILGAVIAIRGAKPMRQVPKGRTDHLAQLSPRAEVGLLYQGEHRLVAFGSGQGMLVARSHHALIGLLDPIAPATGTAIDACLTGLEDQAKAQSCSSALYKAGARTAARARKRGYSCLRIAKEAIVMPGSYRLDAPNRAGLRRKLRRAAATGVSVTPSVAILDWSALDSIATDWSVAHGGERGFSMGRYCPNYLAQQRLYIAWLQGQAIAFVSFHQGKTEWTLDLIRSQSTVPDGTMQALIQRAIDDAKTAGIARLSLAAVPDWSATGTVVQKLLRGIYAQTDGLSRFKSGFAPEWRPLYLAAPSATVLALVATEIARKIHAPTPLPKPQTEPMTPARGNIGFASPRHSWHRQKE